MTNQYRLKARDIGSEPPRPREPLVVAKVEQPPVAPGGNLLLQDVPFDPAANPIADLIVAAATSVPAGNPEHDEAVAAAHAATLAAQAAEAAVVGELVVAPPTITVQDTGSNDLLP